MVRMTIEVPEPALAALRKSPEKFAKEIRLANPSRRIIYGSPEQTYNRTK